MQQCVRVRCEQRLGLLFQQQLVGQGVTFRPALESLVQHHTLGFSALELTGQLLCETHTNKALELELQPI